MIKEGIILKEGKEKSVLRGHPWIFSGAIASTPSFADGDILNVFSSDGKFLAQAYFHSNNSLAGRILSFSCDPIEKEIEKKIDEAILLRKSFFDPKITNAFRLINAEGDGLSGLIVDQYADVLVLQIHTAGMEKLKPFIVDLLLKKLNPSCIYEKSITSSRGKEGLLDCEQKIWGEVAEEVEILENGLKFIVSIIDGQKTGFFLDQREMRQWVAKHAAGKRILNCFSYTGGFSVFALKEKALVDSVDSSAEALALAKRNTELNGCEMNKHRLIHEDAFLFLQKDPLDYDLVILDPPAFAKKRSDIESACKGYKQINRLAFEKMPSSSLLLTCSCSYFMDESLFQNIIFQAACEAKRNVKILGRHKQAIDHPISLYHPEGEYLKSLILYLE